ncbi:MAG: hypothetical protein U9P88_00325 [Patescibacteria group bacterium]|nr:hypothetical protein [Patescibacteria group bacterium]
MRNNEKSKGVSLYLALIIMAIILGIVLGLNALFISQTKTIRAMGNSVVSFYTADAGIERVMMEVVNNGNPLALDGISNPPLGNSSTYSITVILPGLECDADTYCVKSVGTYRAIKRAIEISY